MVYVARSPRDVMVSYYHHCRYVMVSYYHHCSWTWQDMTGNVWKWLKMAGNGWKWLEIAGLLVYWGILETSCMRFA